MSWLLGYRRLALCYDRTQATPSALLTLIDLLEVEAGRVE